MVLSSTTITFTNIVFLIIGILMLIGYTLPNVNKYQNYVYGGAKGTDWIVFLVIFAVIWMFFLYFFNPPIGEDSQDYYTLYLNIEVFKQTTFIPFFIQLMFPAFLLAQIAFVFVFYLVKVPNVYLEEMNNINRFTSFIVYNLEYYKSDQKIVAESLKGLEKDRFYYDVKGIYFSNDLDMEEKLQLLSEVYTFKHLQIFFRLFKIILEKGVSDVTLQSINIVKSTGDDYYTNMKELYLAKKGATFIIYFILGMMLVMLLIVRTALKIGFVYYLYDHYILIMMFFGFLSAMLVVVTLKYKDNKLIDREGRYV